MTLPYTLLFKGRAGMGTFDRYLQPGRVVLFGPVALQRDFPNISGLLYDVCSSSGGAGLRAELLQAEGAH